MFRILNVEVENGLDIFSTVFYFSTFNVKYFEFKIWFKPNLANYNGHTTQLQATHHAVVFFLLVHSCPLFYGRHYNTQFHHLL